MEKAIDKESRVSVLLCDKTKHIAFVLEIIKNGKDLWDQAKRQLSDPGASPKKKVRLLFSAGEGGKRERVVYWCGTMKGWSSITWWRKTRERLEFLLHGGEKLERGVQFQDAIFCADQWVGELGAQGQEQEGCFKDVLEEGQRGGQEDEQQEE